MKKLFAVLAIAGALVACNSNSENTTTADSTTTVTTDSAAISTPAVTDTTMNHSLDSAGATMSTDTTKK